MLRSSAEVFRVLPKFVPHIVLVDMNIPGISNILTLSFIRRLSELRQTKIIVITHRAHIVESAKSIWRAEVILAKPVSPERLLETVSSCL
jgi:CheY-like chemotaxis protein